MREYNMDLLDRSDYGGFWQRVIALLLDDLILWLPCVAMAFFLGAWFLRDFSLIQSPGTQAVANIGCFAIYSVYFWTSPARATPGKRLMGLIVLSDDGCPIGAGRSVWRFVTQVISCLAIIGPLLIVGSERRQGLHDLLAGTVVVKASAAARVKVAPVE